jgi:cystathionine gamma-synthase
VTPRPETLAAQALGAIEPVTRAVVPPIHVATTFLRDPDNQYRSGFGYVRDDNPAYRAPEAVVNALEGGHETRLFAPGMAAATTAFLALAPGDHVIAPKVMYWGLREWLAGEATRWGLNVAFVDAANIDAIAAAIRPGATKLVWIETPANPLWTITDIAAAAEIAHRAGALLAVDSTVATPVLTRPIELGADLVMHAATKYLNGHSDLAAGTLTVARDGAYWRRIKTLRHDGGAILGSFEAWLLLRGLRTLHVRVRHAVESAARIAGHFRAHPAIVEVLYPGLADAPGHGIAARQMQGGFGAMVSIRVAGGEAAAIGVAAAVELWKRATSLGGVESLIEHRASIEGVGTPAPADLLRLSVGLEHPDDLIGDLDQGLTRVTRS